jgi:hypothetical protein
MQDTMKVAAAALGGYVLGRTKKAKAAVGLALWLGGRRHIGEMVGTEAMRLLRSEQARDLADSGRQAALALFETKAGQLGDALQRRAAAVDPGAAAPPHPPQAGTANDKYDDNDEYEEYEDDSDEYDDDTDERDEDDEPRRVAAGARR